MPRNVRNFWVECKIDGQKTRLAGGPRSKDGGFSLTIYQRRRGNVEVAFSIEGRADTDGRIFTRVVPVLDSSRDVTTTTTAR